MTLSGLILREYFIVSKCAALYRRWGYNRLSLGESWRVSD